MQIIASTTLGSNTASITFSSIPNTYRHLYIVGSVRSQSTSVNYGQAKIELNGVTNNDYTTNTLIRYTKTPAGTETGAGFLTGSFYDYYNVAWDGLSTQDWNANIFAYFDLWIMNYTTTQNKVGITQGHNPRMTGVNSSITNGMISNYAYNGSVIGAINQVKISEFSGVDLSAGSKLYLYGTLV